MAGSRRSPILRDQWSADPDRDPRERERRRGRGPGRDRGGRNRGRDRGRPFRPNNRNYDRPGRSPPRASRFGPDSHDLGGLAPNRSPPRGSPGSSNVHNDRPRDSNISVSAAGDWNANAGPFDRVPGPRRDESPSGPPSKRQRTRSPSTHGRRGPLPPPRSNYPKYVEGRDRSPSFKKRGGRTRGAPRRRSPRRGRDRRGKERHRPDMSRTGRSVSPGRERGFHPSLDRRSRSPSGDNYSDHGSHLRSDSRHSVRSANSRYPTSPRRTRRDSEMSTSRPIQSSLDVNTRSPTPSRHIPSFGSDNLGPQGITQIMGRIPVLCMEYALMRTISDAAGPDSHYGSPQPSSPFSAERGGRSAAPSHSGPGTLLTGRITINRTTKTLVTIKATSTVEAIIILCMVVLLTGVVTPVAGLEGTLRARLGDFPARALSYFTTGLHNATREDISATCNGLHQDREDVVGNIALTQHIARVLKLPIAHSLIMTRIHLEMVTIRPPSRDFRENEHHAQPQSDSGDHQSMPAPNRERNEPTPANKGGKFSFAFKSKAAPSPAPKPVPDLAQRMQVREPAPRAPGPSPNPRNRFTNEPLSKFKPEPRADRRDRDRGRNRDRDRRDFRGAQDFRGPPEFPRDRRDDRRFDQRRDRRQGERPSDRAQGWPDRRRDPSPEPPREASPPKQKRLLTRPKPRPTLPEEFANADSVYFRKPGNESVIGAGTYGKVFKGIHVYTQRKVALKKIRMEGEKDGFPVTAVREIKLLQHLRNHNVVSLLEVMVEKNECFMVFEYLSHDLTGLINHPTFSLTHSHMKDLAKQMFEGLNYLHHRGVLHRDIKAANILISNRGLLKFADFGLARFFSKSRQLDYTNRVITIWYRPPELLLGETRYGPAVDVWSAACVCMEMFTKKAVFPGEGGELSQMDKLYNALGTPTKTEWPDLVEMPWFHLMRPMERKKRVFEDMYRDVLTPGAMDLISSIFRYDPSQRPSAEDVLKHSYFVSEEPAPQPPIELEHVEGDWHEFESKALRKSRRAEYQNQKDRDKRKADASVPSSDRDSKRAKPDSGDLASAH
ncbi:hypothetical protein N7461_001731 [Penicillium sp. DV-2018c]|nr:hypothetical protein N7461_001731 [Penicillium sp. DV-2018c]